MSTRTVLVLGLAAAVLGGALFLLALVGGTEQPALPTTASAHEQAAAAAAPARAPVLGGSSTSLDDVLGELAAATTDDDRRRLSRETHDALVAALERDPDGTLAVLEAWVATADPAQLATQVAIGAMVAVGTPAIQSALVTWIDTRSGDEAFVRLALPTIAFLGKPTLDTETAVRAWTSEVQPERTRTMAHLALGTMATQLATGESARSSAIVDEYAARLASASTATERARWLQVLGNARTPAAAQAVSTQLTAEDPAVRSRAVEALRLAPTPGVDAVLTGALDDADPRVRASAAWSLGYRSPDRDTMRAVVGKVKREQDATVTTRLLDVMWIRRAIDHTAVTQAVRHVAREHPSQAVRAHAQQLLDQAS